MIIDKHTMVVGLPGSAITLEELYKLCNDYKDAIESFYLSPPFGEYYNWKGETIPHTFTYENCKLLKDQINIIRNFGFKIRVVLNNAKKFNKNPLNDIYKFCDLFGRPDYIVTMDNYVQDFYTNLDIPLAYSCMNKITNESFDNIKKCEVVVLNSEHNYNIDLMQKIKSMNKQVELVVNNSCSYVCNKQCNDSCTQCEADLIHEIGIEKTLALQALFPCELKLLQPYVDLWKVSNRPSTYQRTTFMMQRWTKGLPLNDLKKRLITVSDYTSDYNMAAFRTDEFRKDKVNFDKVVDYKNEIWSTKLNKNIDIRNL